MLPNEKKNKMKLSVLSMLRENGMPSRPGSEEMDEEMLLASNEEENLSPEEKKKKDEEEAKRRPPNIAPEDAKSIRDAFRRRKF